MVFQEVPRFLGIPAAVTSVLGTEHDFRATCAVTVSFTTVADASRSAAALVDPAPFFKGAFSPKEMNGVQAVRGGRSGGTATVRYDEIQSAPTGEH